MNWELMRKKFRASERERKEAKLAGQLEHDAVGRIIGAGAAGGEFHHWRGSGQRPPVTITMRERRHQARGRGGQNQGVDKEARW